MTPADFHRIRKAIGLTQAEMGDKIGKTARQVHNYENGHTTIPLLVARAVEAMERDRDGN